TALLVRYRNVPDRLRDDIGHPLPRPLCAAKYPFALHSRLVEDNARPLLPEFLRDLILRTMYRDRPWSDHAVAIDVHPEHAPLRQTADSPPHNAPEEAAPPRRREGTQINTDQKE